MNAARSRRVRHVLGYVAALQLLAAVPLAFSSTDRPRLIKTVAVVRAVPTTDTAPTAPAPIIPEPTTSSTTTAAPVQHRERTGTVYGVIGAGEGGSGGVELVDDM